MDVKDAIAYIDALDDAGALVEAIPGKTDSSDINILSSSAKELDDNLGNISGELGEW